MSTAAVIVGQDNVVLPSNKYLDDTVRVHGSRFLLTISCPVHDGPNMQDDHHLLRHVCGVEEARRCNIVQWIENELKMHVNCNNPNNTK